VAAERDLDSAQRPEENWRAQDERVIVKAKKTAAVKPAEETHMNDPRIDRLAEILVRYSTRVKPEDLG